MSIRLSAIVGGVIGSLLLVLIVLLIALLIALITLRKKRRKSVTVTNSELHTYEVCYSIDYRERTNVYDYSSVACTLFN